MNIYLVRHGEAAATWQESEDPGLSELGHKQAVQAAEKLIQGVDSDIGLISSPLRRARETADPLSEALGTELTIIDAFREIPTPVERSKRQGWLNSIARQNWSEQQTMVRDWQQSLLRELGKISQPTVVFTHFMVINAVVSNLSDGDKVLCFLPANASVTILERSENGLQLLELGHELRTRIN